MNNDVWGNFILYKTMKIIKKVTTETYSDAEDIVEAFDMEKIFHDLRQGDLFITQYFNLLIFETTKWDCPKDVIKYKKIVEKKHAYKFL